MGLIRRCDLAGRGSVDSIYHLGILVDTDGNDANPNLLDRYLMQPGILKAFGWRFALGLVFLGLHLLWCGVELVNIGLSIFVHHSEPVQIATKNHDSLSLPRLDSCRFIRSP